MTTDTLKRPLAILTVLGGLLMSAAPAGAQEPAKVKAVVVLIGANDYGFTDADPGRNP